jgi:hypothetical protein
MDTGIALFMKSDTNEKYESSARCPMMMSYPEISMPNISLTRSMDLESPTGTSRVRNSSSTASQFSTFIPLRSSTCKPSVSRAY